MDTSLLTSLVILLLVFLSSAVFFLALAYQNLVKQFKSLQKEQDFLYAKAHHKANKIVDAARDKSLEIIDQSQHKAQEIVMSADFFSAISEKELTEKVKDASQKQTEEYVKELRTVRAEIIEAFQAVSEKVRDEALKEIADFRKDVETATVKTETAINTQLDKQYQAVNQDLEKYKAEMMKKVNADIVNIVQDVMGRVATKTLSGHEHETIVLNALEEAKKQHVF